MDLEEALRTTAAVRDFLADPVPAEVLRNVLEVARFAPSGGNRQGWHVIVVDDAQARRRLRDLYLPGWYEYLAQHEAGLVPFSPANDPAAEAMAARRVPELADRAAAGPGGFAEHLDRAPALLLLLADLRALAAVDRDLPRYTFAGGASVYPFAWNLLLAARAVGLGGVLTTMPIRAESSVKEAFGIPDDLAVAGLVVLGFPRHRPTRLSRRTVDSFTTIDRFDGRRLG